MVVKRAGVDVFWVLHDCVHFCVNLVVAKYVFVEIGYESAMLCSTNGAAALV